MVDDKRTAILNATMDLVAERGFHGTPMSLVARRSGVSTGIIYHYFEGKDALIHTLYFDIKTRFSAALMLGDPGAQPWPDHLLTIWRNAFNFYANHPRETVFLEQYENSPYMPNMAVHMDFDANTQALASLIETDVADGRLRPMPVDVMYVLSLGVALGLAKRQIAGSIDLDDAALTEIAEALVRALEPR